LLSQANGSTRRKKTRRAVNPFIQEEAEDVDEDDEDDDEDDEYGLEQGKWS
jgi:hypothetical protein